MADTPTIAPIKKPTPPAPPVPPRPYTLPHQTQWEAVILRAIADGERRINKLLKIGRNAGGSDKKTVRDAVLASVSQPLPPGASDCVQYRVSEAAKQPDNIAHDSFTGRWESKGASRANQYFWAINQAGNVVIAVRTLRDYTKHNGTVLSEQYVELRGDLQGDRTVVLFQTNHPGKNPRNFWGCLQRSGNILIWYAGSYLDAHGERVDVENRSDLDENLDLVGDRPTMMASMYKSDNKSLSILLQEREWFPLTAARYQFVEEGARSDLLRALLREYLETPDVAADKATFKELEAKDRATSRIVDYVAHLLWNGEDSTEPKDFDLPPNLKDAYGPALATYLERARRIRHGHHNNLELATHVAKIWLARQMMDTTQTKRSFLDLLIEITQKRKSSGSPGGKRHSEALFRLLRIPLDRSTGIYVYHLKLEIYRFLGFKVEGTLVVEPLSQPKWERTKYDVRGWWAGAPIFGQRDVLFDLDIETPQQWFKEDFEGSIFIGELTLAIETKWISFGAGSARGAHLKSNKEMDINIWEAEGASLDFGSGKTMKPTVKITGGVMYGSVSLPKSKLIDLSLPYPASSTLTMGLEAAAHFCFGDSLLTPTGRQLLRVVCADRLAALSNPHVDIAILGHTDRPATPEFNLCLSKWRAKNLKTALMDILGKHPLGALQVSADDIHTYGLGELEKAIKDRLKGIPDKTAEHIRDPYNRRVDILIDATFVAAFVDSPLPP